MKQVGSSNVRGSANIGWYGSQAGTVQRGLGLYQGQALSHKNGPGVAIARRLLPVNEVKVPNPNVYVPTLFDLKTPFDYLHDHTSLAAEMVAPPTLLALGRNDNNDVGNDVRKREISLQVWHTTK
jgi:hypothetical protein